MNDVVKFILELLVGSGVILLIITQTIRLFFSRELEKFKANLEKESLRHEVQFRSLHLERARVIKEVYRLIARSAKELESLVAPMQLVGEPDQLQKARTFAETANTLSDLYLENEIFFSDETSLMIRDYLKNTSNIWRQWQYIQERKQLGESTIQEWGEVWDIVKSDIPVIKKRVRDAFRSTLGAHED